ncbi:alpha-2,3-sialyltransferase [Seminibacterium arietis]|uniref:Alpha-2,3-sialyltransferase n=1 Tax=Seminibacterium arietis TaxID=1173502 RepID=A0ABW3I8T7_9PAST
MNDVNKNKQSQFPKCKAALIAGNGPSLAQIDYNRLPDEIDVFRCNQFYLEEQYYVGKQIKVAFFHNALFIEQQATMSELHKNNEYQCEQIAYSDFESRLLYSQKAEDLLNWFPDTLNAFILYREKLPELAKHTLHLALFHNKVVTSGVIMALTAVAMGYKKLYFTGIDLYESTKQTYAFDSKKTNLIKLQPRFKSNLIEMNKTWHSAETDLSILHLLQELYGIEIYSVSPISPLSKHLPLAPKTGLEEVNRNKMYFAKPKDCLKDIKVPSSAFYRYFRKKYHPQKLKNNLIYRLIFDLLHLPSHIRKYLHHKKKL